MAFHLKPTTIPDIKHIIPDVFGDERGFFMEQYKQSVFAGFGIPTDVVQEAMSYSEDVGLIRALHFQKPPHAQGKIVRVLKGAVLDVAVDIRRGSPTYGKHVAIELSAQNKEMVYVPAGFAHGIEVLEEGTMFQYLFLHSEYAPESEGGLVYNDPALGIEWLCAEHSVNERDQGWGGFEDFETPFVY